jgi:transcriptional regulator with XRE-family HTH domain
MLKKDERQRSVEWRARVGSAVRRARGKLTQTQLATKAGLDWTTISNIERGAAAPDFATLDTLADILHVTVDELSGRAPVVLRAAETVSRLPEGPIADAFRRVQRELDALNDRIEEQAVQVEAIRAAQSEQPGNE